MKSAFSCLILACLSFYIYSSPGILSADTIIETDTILALRKIKFDVDLFQIEIVDPSSGVQFYKSGILYLQDSKEASKDIRVSFGTLDTYCAAIDGVRTRAPDFFSRQFAFPFPSEATTFTGDYQEMYFVKKSKFKGTEGDNVKIYHSKYITSKNKKKTGWSQNVAEMPFNGTDYSCTQPTVSADGKTLIFASDMPGGKGKLDLYIVHQNNGSWSDPVNLGNDINTREDENFPFLLNPSTLFFSSNGHKGLGGYDIYIAKYDGQNWTQVANLGPTINGDMDEIAYTMNRTNQELAFFSSNRNLFKKEMQVFQATLTSGSPLMSETVLFLPSDLAYITISRESSEIVDEVTFIPTLPEEIPEVSEKVIIPEKEVEEEAPPVTQLVRVEKPELAVDEPEEVIEFRVQFKASSKSLGQFDVTIENNTYMANEYFYKGAYRYTIGRFNTQQAAYALQKTCREAGYRDAFVAAFKNNERLLKIPRESLTEKPEIVEPKPVEVFTQPEVEPEITTQETQEIIDFRVQFRASTKSLGTFKVSVGDRDYEADEYSYKGVFRYTIGKFDTPQEAYELQKKCRQAGYPDAFVAAFKNNERTLDTKVFERFR